MGIQVCKVLYLSSVRGLFAYASHVCLSLVAANSNIVKIGKFQHRLSMVPATSNKIYPFSPYNTDISYKERLQSTHILPVCYWQEYLDMVYGLSTNA